ncbi:hypothetical protein AQUCO_08400053v1 [Aquilegia coerulea]|uniref:Neprosin PEP catalytic domain-containing protein n=1 Tax=Aquilegia coerulea TaxID=218851 RepID=A0A2G5C6X3_AQUCA|nr:hypothetical protein AQUCO_08400053v1 [Aquilegia coerulea]
MTEEGLELEQQLNHLNKPFIKSIQNKDGRFYDCVHLYKQTALDHPNLLKHKIQMRPTSLPKGFSTSSGGSSHVKPSEIEQLEGKGCPIGTVPIKRITKEDLIRTRSLSNVHPLTVGSPGAHVSHFFLSVLFGRHLFTKTIGDFAYFGAQAVIVTNNPMLYSNTQSSETMISVSNGVPNELNSIDVGWTVNPTLYGDNKTRLYTRWTIDGYRNTGCYNTMCPGFVQTSSNITLDATFWPTSTYNGHQFGSKFSVFLDNSTRNWWFAVDDNLVGYWPGSIFTCLYSFASTIVWGGATRSPVGLIYKPEMGSGHFPSEGFRKASFFKQLQLIPLDEGYVFRDLRGTQEIEQVTDKPNCYGVGGITDFEDGKYSFYFGGPGGICGY